MKKINLKKIFQYQNFSKSLKNWDSDSINSILTLTELKKIGVFYISSCVSHNPQKIKYKGFDKKNDWVLFEINGKIEEFEY